MLRFVLRRLPRFGLLSLFAAMLLLVSAAGWWKFHEDLFQEEQSVVKALKAEGCDVSFVRGALADDAADWRWGVAKGSLRDRFERISYLDVYGAPSDVSRRRAAALPGLKESSIRYRGVGGLIISNVHFDLPATPVSSIDEIVDAPTPTFDAWRLPDHALTDIPAGNAVPDLERDRVLAAVRAAWADVAIPERFVRRIESYEGMPARATWADGRRRLLFTDESPFLTLHGDDCRYVLELFGDEWRLADRVANDAARRRFADEEPRDAAAEFQFWSPWHDWIDPQYLDQVTTVERIDERRVRLTFAPHVRTYQFETRKHEEDYAELSMILREDLEWMPTAQSAVTWYQPSPGRPRERRPEWEVLRLERRNGVVVPIERLRNGFRTRYAWSVDEPIDPTLFSPDRYLAAPLPPPRDVPFWRWHRVTFALASGLVGFLIVRGVLVPRRKRSEAFVVPSPAEAT